MPSVLPEVELAPSVIDGRTWGIPLRKLGHAPTTWEDALMTSTKTKTKISENPCDPNYLILEGDMLREVSGSFLECPKR